MTKKLLYPKGGEMKKESAVEQLPPCSPEEAHLHLQNCEAYIRDSEYERAEHCAKQFLDDTIYPPSVVGRAYIDIAEVCWRTGHYPDAIEYATTAQNYAQHTDDFRLQSRIHAVLGISYKRMGDFEPAIENFSSALRIDERDGFDKGVGMNLSNVGSVYHEMKDYDRAIEYYHKAVAVNEKIGSKAGLSIALGNISDLYLATQNYAHAIPYAMRAFALDQEMGSVARLAKQYSSLGLAYMGMGEVENALEYFLKSIEAHEASGNYADSAIDYGNVGLVYAREGSSFYDIARAEEYLRRAIEIARKYGVKLSEASYTKHLASLLASQARWEEAYSLYERYHALSMELSKSEALLASIRFDHQHKAAEREKQLAIERARHEVTKQLLHNVLPPTIAHRMVAGENLIAEKLSQVTILFADIVNFTHLSQTVSPEELVQGLDRIFSEFDVLAEKYGLEKIKTIGDAYMVVAGAPEPRADHSQVMTQMAMDMLEAMKQFTSSATGEQLQIRIGIHSGEVVAGVIGKKKFAYDLWGDAVNMAARMESHGEAGKIHVSEEFMRQLAMDNTQLVMSNEEWTVDNAQRTTSESLQHFTLSSSTLPIADSQLTFLARGEMEIKGKGTMRTYFLEKL